MQGWQPHPKNPNYYYRMLTKAQIEAELEAAEAAIQARIKRAVNAALDREHKKRLEVLDEKVAKLSAQIAQEKFEAKEAAVPGYPTKEQLGFYQWVLSDPMSMKQYRVPRSLMTHEARVQWGL